LKRPFEIQTVVRGKIMAPLKNRLVELAELEGEGTFMYTSINGGAGGVIGPGGGRTWIGTEHILGHSNPEQPRSNR
jgi:hypothetical protein